MIFDVTDKPTFEHIKAWLLETGKHADPSCNRLLVGNKVDREEDREVATALAQVRLVSIASLYPVCAGLRLGRGWSHHTVLRAFNMCGARVRW